MSGNDCRNKLSFSCRRKNVSNEADWTSSGRMLQSRGPAVENERSPTATSCEGRMSRHTQRDTRRTDYSTWVAEVFLATRIQTVLENVIDFPVTRLACPKSSRTVIDNWDTATNSGDNVTSPWRAAVIIR